MTMLPISVLVQVIDWITVRILQLKMKKYHLTPASRRTPKDSKGYAVSDKGIYI